MSKQSVFLALIFFLSGFSTLVYQTVWQRVLTQEIGVDSLSVTYIVTIFMIGLGFGALYGARVSQWRRNIAYVYGFIEIGTGVFGYISIPILRMFNQYISWGLPESIFLDFICNLMVMVLPIFLMGMTAPLVIHIGQGSIRGIGRAVGYIYGVNILGAASGAIMTGVFFIELFGLTVSALMAASINVLIGVMMLVAYRKRAVWEGEAGYSTANSADQRFLWRAIPTAVILGSFCFGFLTLSYEILLFRIVSHLFSAYAILFPLMISAYLMVMSAGNAIGGAIAERTVSVAGLHKWLSACAIMALATTLIVFSVDEKMLGSIGVHGGLIVNGHLVAGFIVIMLLMTPVFFLSSFFPFVIKMVTAHPKDSGKNTGLVLFFYTMGNVCGVFLTGIVLLEYLGTINSARVLSALLVVGIWAFFLHKHDGKVYGSIAVVSGFAAIVIFLLPADYYKRFTQIEEHTPAAQVIETKRGVFTLYPGSDKHGTFYRIDVNRSSGTGRIYTKLITEIPNCFEGLLKLDKEFKPQRALVIGVGEGIVPYCLLRMPSIEEVVIVDINPEVVDILKANVFDAVKDSLKSPKVRIVISDGRRFIQKAIAQHEKYDVIQLGINTPIYSGSGNIYTRESIEKFRGCLSTGGYFLVRDYATVVKTALPLFSYGFSTDTQGHNIVLTDNSNFQKANATRWHAINPVFLKAYPVNRDDHPIMEYEAIRRFLRRPRAVDTLNSYPEAFLKQE